MKTILVVGGAGYIGSHTNKELYKKGYNTIVLDNLTYGHKGAVKWGNFIQGDLADKLRLREIFQSNKIDAVIHFAAFAYVGESVKNPDKYYNNNVVNTLNLLNIMKEFNCNIFIFSSTCATYGNPIEIPITENHPQVPINPYGQSKLMIEKILEDYSYAYDLKYVILRYFNAAGADPDNEIGENHNPETHLIPLILDVAIGKKEDIKIFGTDYDTVDGSCIRDYIHVTDLANAHILSLEYLFNGYNSNIFNLGNGNGYSVKEIINCAENISGINIKKVNFQRREGDPAILIGSSDKAKAILSWLPKYNQIESIISTAWNWHKKLNNK